ncbi:hypothetical protein ANCCAN_04001 [Ancylostoma caninum]|uniref:Uncharacterized protein n=1 Tax=Ancylostoma caninum TaxID=29170 RepID=A0A368H3X8_ANCCA|nr:hypothetical protein ANCCAN_04001 [Ancylostoma caninum]
MVQRIREDSFNAGGAPLKQWISCMRQWLEQDPSLGTEMCYKQKCKHDLVRATNAHRDKLVTMEKVLSYLANLWDGSTFLQELLPRMHIYYSDLCLEKACRNGLRALVADGVHSKAPRGLKRNSQLYVVHGVCDGGVDVTCLLSTR